VGVVILFWFGLFVYALARATVLLQDWAAKRAVELDKEPWV
jgi:hypothetical protein